MAAPIHTMKRASHFDDVPYGVQAIPARQWAPYLNQPFRKNRVPDSSQHSGTATLDGASTDNITRSLGPVTIDSHPELVKSELAIRPVESTVPGRNASLDLEIEMAMVRQGWR